jgi:BTB/POZ domain
MNVHIEKFLKDVFAMNENDINIVSADGAHPANSQLLKARSPIFRSMLTLTMKEAVTKEIKMINFNGAAVSALIGYIQTCSLPSPPSNWNSIIILLQICELADQYVLPDLLNHTKTLLLNFVNSLSTAVDVWCVLHSTKYGLVVKEEILRKCQQALTDVMWAKKAKDKNISLDSIPIEVKEAMFDFLMKFAKCVD